MPSAIIFGVTGQDGSYLSEWLLHKGYDVIGVVRRASTNTTTERLYNCVAFPKFQLVEGDVLDSTSITGLIAKYQPDECYNLAAQSHVGTSFQQPNYTFQACANGPMNILEAIRVHSPQTRMYQASTSEMFGNNFFVNAQDVRYQDESTPMQPTSPYAIAKTAAHHLIDMYRKAYGIHASAGILFNHESERRGENFVTRKVTKWVAEFLVTCANNGVATSEVDTSPLDYIVIKDNLRHPKLRLGNLDSARDWGYAPDYVRAMWVMLQQEKPDDYVIATGQTYTIEYLVEQALKAGVVSLGVKDVVYIDPEFSRPSELYYLCGNPAKAMSKLGWRPQVTFQEMVQKMVNYDTTIALAKTR